MRWLFVVLLAMILASALVFMEPAPASAGSCGAITTPWNVPPGDDDCDGFASAREQYLATFRWVTCPATSAPNDEPDAWPVDNNDDQKAGLADILAYIPWYLTSVPPAPARLDLNQDGMIGLADILTINPFYLQSCALGSPPVASTSRYVGDLTGDCTTDYNALKDYGTSQGLAGQLGVLVLDFHGQWYQNGTWGTKDWSYNFHPDYDIECAAMGFIDGFWYNSSYSQALNVAIGTNNGSDIDYSSAGRDWAWVVTDLENYVVASGYDVQLSIWGASDMEPGFGPPVDAKDWADGYHTYSASVPSYYDYGSADGCPLSGTDQYTEPPGFSCSNGWHQSDVEYVSWGNPSAYPLPDIYLIDGENAYQWQQISVYAYYHEPIYGALYFYSSLTQSQACQQAEGTEYACDPITKNTPGGGWRQLYVAANADSRTATSIPYSSDIRWDP